VADRHIHIDVRGQPDRRSLADCNALLPPSFFPPPPPRPPPRRKKTRSVAGLFVLLIKNALGLIMIMAGIIMLLIPGQGVLTIVIGLMLLDFPGKYKLEQWAVRRGPVLRVINHARRRARRPPLVI